MSALFIPLSYFTPQRQFTHVLFRILHCIREATLHLFHEIPIVVPRYYTIPSLTLFCTITQFGDLIITRETQLLSTHLEQYYSAILLTTLPHTCSHPQSSDNLSPRYHPLHYIAYPHPLHYPIILPFSLNKSITHTMIPQRPDLSQTLNNTSFSPIQRILIQLHYILPLFPTPSLLHPRFISSTHHLLLRVIPLPLPLTQNHAQISHLTLCLPQWHLLQTPHLSADIPSTAQHSPLLLAPILLYHLVLRPIRRTHRILMIT